MLEIYFESYGCTANHNSTEIMKGLVRQAGLNITSKIEFADFVVINSCVVKEPTEEKIRRRVSDLLKQGKKVIVAGCMPSIANKKLNDSNLFLLDVSHVKDICSLIKEVHENNYSPKKYLKKRNEVKLDLPKISKDKFIGITQISEGCLGDCSYCIVKIIKGKLFSYPKEKIIQSVKNDLSNGCKEIWITSQDNASYGNENSEYSLPDLLNEILSIKKDFFVRVGMMNPDNVLKILPELIEIYKKERMFKFLHIPIQSGNNKILKLMKRNYKKEDILKIINEFKKQIPEITISTDIIVGFPGETEQDFQETLELIKEIKPEILNISKFWPRKKTPASKLKMISPRIRIERAAKLSRLHLEICNENQKKFIDWQGKVLVDQKGFDNTYLARNKEYKLFAVHSKEKILGKTINIKVKKIMPHYLIGEIIED